MSNVPTILAFKVKMFFSPSYRGKYGPFPLIALMLIFVPSGLGTGYALGTYMETLGPDQMVATFGGVLAAMMAFGFVFSLGVGITAQPSELDFLMTSPIKSREYLISDLLFQLTSLTLAGGVAMYGALIGFIAGMGVPPIRALPLLAVVAAYGLMIFLIIQSITIARIRHPKGKVRQAVVLLLVLSLVVMLPALGFDLGIEFDDLPIPQAAFSVLSRDALFGLSPDLTSLAVAVVFFAFVGVLWMKLSSLYFFYGIKPTLSSGFGQVDMGAKMAQQRRLIGVFGGLTDKVALKTYVGSDLGLMTRLNIVRIWRDGSIVFLIMITALFLASGIWGSSGGQGSGLTTSVLQGTTWPIAILALNWCYYERANLWIPVVGGRSLISYFQGLMLSFIMVGYVMSAFMVGILAAVNIHISMQDLAFVILAPVADSAIAAMLLTRITVKPGAFSPGLLAVLFFTFAGGAAIAFSGSLVVGVVGSGTAVNVAVQVAAVAVIAVATYLVGRLALRNLSRTFKFQ